MKDHPKDFILITILKVYLKCSHILNDWGLEFQQNGGDTNQPKTMIPYQICPDFQENFNQLSIH